MNTGLEIKKVGGRYLSRWVILFMTLLAPALQAQTLGSAKDYCQRGNERRGRGQLNQAIEDYDRAIELDPRMAPAFQGRGAARREKRDFAGALADFDRAVVLDPRSDKAYFERGSLRR